MKKSEGIRVIIKENDVMVGVRRIGTSEWGLPGGVAYEMEIEKSVPMIVNHLTGFDTSYVVPIGRFELNVPEIHNIDEEKVTVEKVMIYNCGWTGEMSPAEGWEVSWVTISDILAGKDGLIARDVFNRIGMMDRPKLELEELYKISAKILDGSDSASRMELATEAADLVIDEWTFLIDTGKSKEIDRILGTIDVPKVHADVLDAMLAMVEQLEDSPNKNQFIQDASAIIAEVDRLIPKRKLILNGVVISNDVRGDARKLYKESARKFKEILEKKGTLQEFYHRKLRQ
ncbi:MAG: hypothetical protein WC708_01485 [Lentisphaeria bacterium]|jgi:hypothetical protein